MARPRIGSHYTPYGQNYFDQNAEEDNMWRDCPNPALLPPTVGFAYVNDFVTWSADDWTATEVEAGTGNTTIGIIDGEGGVLGIVCDANENDGGQIQLKGEMFKLAATNRVWFDARVNIVHESTQSDFAVGLATTTTTAIASAPNDYVMFVKDDGDTNIDFVSAKDGTETERAAVATASNDTWVLLGFKWDGSTLTPYINGVAGTAISTNVPDNENMSPVLAYLNGAGSAENDTFAIDWVRCVSIYNRT